MRRSSLTSIINSSTSRMFDLVFTTTKSVYKDLVSDCDVCISMISVVGIKYKCAAYMRVHMHE